MLRWWIELVVVIECASCPTLVAGILKKIRLYSLKMQCIFSDIAHIKTKNANMYGVRTYRMEVRCKMYQQFCLHFYTKRAMKKFRSILRSIKFELISLFQNFEWQIFVTINPQKSLWELTGENFVNFDVLLWKNIYHCKFLKTLEKLLRYFTCNAIRCVYVPPCLQFIPEGAIQIDIF
jgi:hypothetical protein